MTWPSPVVESISGDRPHCFAAVLVSKRRTFAPAFAGAVPPSCIEWLPEVTPSSGVSAVSAVMNVMDDGGRSNSSAAT